MINVVAFAENGKYTGLKVSGHAGFEEEGMCGGFGAYTESGKFY